MRSFALCLLLIAVPLFPAAAGTGWGVSAEEFANGTRYTPYLQAQRVTGWIESGVAQIVLEQTYCNPHDWQGDGAEVLFTLRPSPLVAPWSYRITELGQWHEGFLRGKDRARAEYDAIVNTRKDPGLLEWLGDGCFRSSLFPVPPRGGTKDAVLIYDAALATTSRGELVLQLPFERGPIQTLDLELRIRDARGIASIALPGPFEVQSPAAGSEVWIVRAKVQRCQVREEVPLTIALQHPTPANALVLADGRFLLSVPQAQTPDARHLLSGGFVIGRVPAARLASESIVVGRSWRLSAQASTPVSLVLEPRLAAQGPSPIASVFDRLEAAARASDAFARRASAAEVAAVMTRVRQTRVATPFTSFLARPGQTAQPVPEPPRREASAGVRRAAGASESRPAASVRIPLPRFGLFQPSFQRSRERAYKRACWANQKTLAGALEMYLLDNSLTMDGLLAAAGKFGVESRLAFEVNRLDDVDAVPVRATQDASLVASLAAWTPTTPGATWLAPVPEALWRDLVAGGYLTSLLDDPGQGASSHANYALTGLGCGVFCVEHGTIPIEGKIVGRTAREQLENAGVLDARWLSAASEVEHSGGQGTGIQLRVHELAAGIVSLVALVLIVSFQLHRRRIARATAFRHAAKAFATGMFVMLLDSYAGMAVLGWAFLVAVAALPVKPK